MRTTIFSMAIVTGSFLYAGNLSASGGNDPVQKPVVCDLGKVKNTETVLLSSLVENCVLLHFEDKDEALVKPWYTTVTEKYIGVRQDGGKPYKLFDRSGKFLCDIGRAGQGPGEFAIAVYDDLIDDKNELVYFTSFMRNKILVYNTSGKFIKNIIAPQELHKPKLHLSDSGVLTVVHMPFKGEKVLVFQFDANGEVIKELPSSEQFLTRDYNEEILNARNTNAFEFHHTLSDTLYHYNMRRNAIEPVFTMQISASEKPWREYLELNDRYITCLWGKEKQVVSTDKKTKASSFIKVVNDYYGNMAVPVSVLNFRNGWFVYNLEPAQLKDEIEQRLKESNCTVQDKQKLTKLLSTLDENANNVLFVGKLK